MKRFFTLIFGVFFLAIVAFGQSQNLRFKHISLEEGLSYSYVLSICQDSRGFMWVGTSEGLNRYDGYEFRVFKNTGDTFSISDNQVNHIMEDSRGKLWVSTWNGINVYDPETERFTRYQHNPQDPTSISSNYIQICYEDKAGNIWVGVNGAEIGKGGLNLYDRKTGTFSHYPASKADSIGTSGEGVQTVFEDRQGNFWVGTTSTGLKRFDRGKRVFTRYELDPEIARSITRNSVNVIFEDSRDRLWVGSREIGLCLVDRDAKEVRRFSNGRAYSIPPGTAVLSLGEDISGNLWVGMDNNGLGVYSPDLQLFSHYTHDPSNASSLNNNSIYSICRDDKGNMWLGTFAGGVNFFNIDGNRFSHFRQSLSEQGMNSNTVFCIRERSDGKILLGTDGGGLNIYDPGTGLFTHKTHVPGKQNSICGNNVLSVLEDVEGNIWVGTWGEGVTRYNPKTDTYRHYRNDPNDAFSLGGNNAWTIYEDSGGNIWIGTYWGGLSLYDRKNDRFIQYKMDVEKPNTISSNVINSVIEDDQGIIWIGTVNGGLDRYDRKTGTFRNFLHHPDSNSLSNNVITSLNKDSLGNLWVGTANGLNYLNLKSGKFTVYTVRDGLIHNYIRGVLDDKQGNLWVSTNGGISRFHMASKAVKNFTVADGLQAPEFKTHAALRSSTGRMYFGGINGFNEFHPDRVDAAPHDPPIVFTDFRVFSEHVPVSPEYEGEEFVLRRSVTESSEIVLSHKESVFSFEFASLNYTDTRKKQYMYKLEGFDEKWNEIGVKRTATYTNLNSGEYLLKVKGLNNDGEWSDKTLEMKVIITPPIWETWWFRLLVTTVIVGIFVAWFMGRITRMKQQKQELEEQVRERTKELSLVNSELQEQRKRLEILFNDVKDSIRAAEVIQSSLLPSKPFVENLLPESFVLYRPKDVVSGDFYWVDEKAGKIVVAVGDCTGHGVSGAFMSINGYHLLNNAIHNCRKPTAAGILDRLHEEVIRDENSQGQHGMEIALSMLDRRERTIQYAGAGSPLYVVRQGEVLQFPADKFPIGMVHSKRPKHYKNHTLEIFKGDCVYMFSDGYADQVGGESGEKIMYPRFRELLLEMCHKPMEEQRTALEKYLDAWRGDFQQLDDILVVGFRVY